jgi:hypothetical protein
LDYANNRRGLRCVTPLGGAEIKAIIKFSIHFIGPSRAIACSHRRYGAVNGPLLFSFQQLNFTLCIIIFEAKIRKYEENEDVEEEHFHDQSINFYVEYFM